MNKNIIFAFLISTIIIITYYLIFPPTSTITQQTAPQKTPVAIPFQQNTQKINNEVKKPTTILKNKDTKGRILTLESDLFEAKINTRGAVLESFILKKYNHSSEPKLDFLKIAWNSILGKPTIKRSYDPDKKIQMIDPANLLGKKLPWQFFLQQGETLYFETNQIDTTIQGEKTIVFRAVSETGVIIEKRFFFNAKEYLVKNNITVFNNTDQTLPVEPSFVIGSGGELNEADYQARPTRFAIYYDKDLDLYDGDDLSKNNSWDKFDWVGMMDIYFIQALKTMSEGWKIKLDQTTQLFKTKQVAIPFLELVSTKRILNAREKWETEFEIFIGPKEKKQMSLFSNNLIQSLDLTFDFLGQPMLIALRWFYNIIPNWGVAIILLTILVRLMIFPLTYKGMKSMKRMSAFSPKIQALKAKYGSNKEKFNKEMMAIYKKHKINPLGGCLPLILQIPIFIALYSALIPAIELRHSPFIFWIQDLSQSDFIYVLPVLMGLSMHLQQKLAPVAANMDPTQQKIFKWLPVMMTFFFLSFPASLVLYWLTSNIISIGQQHIINKIKIEPVTETKKQTIQEKKKILKQNIKNLRKNKK